ncbi:MAG: RHS repeat-associated core domain-containing protein [Acinetobacter sp.]|uniref:RHS repeat-associated core domain-containing protein n=1 Tax=Acinetobacter sp. TaxID=472 RepID=UPI003D03D127
MTTEQNVQQEQQSTNKPAVELAIFNLESVTHTEDHKFIAHQIQDYLKACGNTSLEQLKANANVPTVANIFALSGAVLDLLLFATDPEQGDAAVQKAALLSMNLIGLYLEPKAEAHVRMALRPLLGLMAEKLYPENGKIQEADIRRMTLHLNAQMAGDLEKFLTETQTKLPTLLSGATNLGMSILNTFAAPINSGLVSPTISFGATAEKRDPTEQFSNWTKPLIDLTKANALANMLPKIRKAQTGTLLQTEATQALSLLPNEIQRQANAGLKYSLAWLIQETLKAIKTQGNKANASVPINQTGEHEQHTTGDTLEFLALQADALSIPICNDQEVATSNSISYAIGAERISHSDFTLPKVGLVFRRLYNSQMSDLDGSNIGARWMIPFSNMIMRKDEGYYYIEEGRVIKLFEDYPKETVEVPFEGIILTPLNENTIRMNFGTSQVFDFISFDKGNTFNLASRVNVSTGDSFEVNYYLIDKKALLTSVNFKTKKSYNTLKFAYNDQGRVVAIFVNDLATPLAQYKYDQQGNLIEAIDENGHVRQYQYNAHHQLTRYTDRTGRGQNISYDSNLPTAKAVEEWADDGSFKNALKWHPRLRQVAVYNAYNIPTYYYFDLDGFTYRIRLADGREKWYSRDKNKKITRQIDYFGIESEKIYNDKNDLVKFIQPNGGVIKFSYDEKSNLTEIKDPEGNIWKREYNSDGLMTKEINPLDQKTEYKYDAEGQLIEVINAKGGIKKIQYDDLGKIIAYTDCSGKQSVWEYNQEGVLKQKISADQTGVQYQYSTHGIDKGQLKTIIFPDGQEEHFEHDQEGRLLKHIDMAGKVTTYQYNTVGLLQKRTDTNQNCVSYYWDKIGNITKVINQKAEDYTFEYDMYNRLSVEKGFDGFEKKYIYDYRGFISSIDLKDLLVNIHYNNEGKISSKEFINKITNEKAYENFEYNLLYNYLSVENEHSKIDYFYDRLGRVKREHQHYKLPNLTPMTAVLRYEYDELGNLINTIRPDGQEVSHLTYGSGHVYGVALNKKDMVGFKRDDLHRETERFLANGLIQKTEYNEVGLLITQNIQPEEGTIDRLMHQVQRQYHYDKNYLLTEVQDNRLGQLKYQYDAIGRLISSQSERNTEKFRFDPAGNLINPIESQTTEVKNNLVKSYQGKQYKYDVQGNVVETQIVGEHLKLKWDNFKRLIQSDYNGQITEYGYDIFGRRLYKANKTNNSFTLFGWDGDLMVWESRQDRDTQNSYTKHYVYEPNSFVPLLQAGYFGFIKLIDTPNYERFKTEPYSIQKDPVWRTDSRKNRTKFERITFYHCDQVGTPQALSNELGERVWEIVLNTWGKTQEIKAQHLNNPLEQSHIRFQGQYYDEETGLHYNRYRYYDPFSARYISKDPIGLIGDINEYKYVNNPNQVVDVLGLAPWAAKAPTKTRCRYVECNFPNPDYLVCSGGALGASATLAVNLNNGNLYRGGGASVAYIRDLTKEMTSVNPKMKFGGGVSCIFYAIQKLPKTADRADATDDLMKGMSVTANANLGIIAFGVDKPIQLDITEKGPRLAKEQYTAVGIGGTIGGGLDISAGGLQPAGNIKDYLFKIPTREVTLPEGYNGPVDYNINHELSKMGNLFW